MDLFNVYPVWDIEPVRGRGCKILDKEGVEYLDLYGGHAVISIGHSHPHYVEAIRQQAERLGFYSNSVKNLLQKELAAKLGEMCGYPDYSLFLCNSGAEANENAMKLSSFHTGRKKILALSKAFHGRTSGAVEATDNPGIQSEFNKNGNVVFTEINNIEQARRELESRNYAAMIVEGIQGVAGIYLPNSDYLKALREITSKTGTLLILDEIQSGYGRTGKFFAHQYAAIRPDIITVAKGIANGFPMGGVIISPEIEAKYGMLGTTFGGNHLACAAAIAVLDVLKSENYIENASVVGRYLMEGLSGNKAIKELRGLGLMIGIEMEECHSDIRNRLLFEKKIFTGVAGKNIIRLLPPLCLTTEEAQSFIDAFNQLTN